MYSLKVLECTGLVEGQKASDCSIELRQGLAIVTEDMSVPVAKRAATIKNIAMSQEGLDEDNVDSFMPVRRVKQTV